MNLKINGDDQSFEQDAINVTQLLSICDVSQPDMVSVQLNGEFINKEDYEGTALKDNDEVDFLYFMGGGLK